MTDIVRLVNNGTNLFVTFLIYYIRINGKKLLKRAPKRILCILNIRRTNYINNILNDYGRNFY